MKSVRRKRGLCFDLADSTGDGQNREMSQVCGERQAYLGLCNSAEKC